MLPPQKQKEKIIIFWICLVLRQGSNVEIWHMVCLLDFHCHPPMYLLVNVLTHFVSCLWVDKNILQINKLLQHDLHLKFIYSYSNIIGYSCSLCTRKGEKEAYILFLKVVMFIIWYGRRIYFHFQEYPSGVILIPLGSRTGKPFRTTNLVVFAPENVPNDSKDNNYIACGDALIVDPGCLSEFHGEVYFHITSKLVQLIHVILAFKSSFILLFSIPCSRDAFHFIPPSYSTILLWPFLSISWHSLPTAKAKTKSYLFEFKC